MYAILSLQRKLQQEHLISLHWDYVSGYARVWRTLTGMWQVSEQRSWVFQSTIDGVMQHCCGWMCVCVCEGGSLSTQSLCSECLKHLTSWNWNLNSVYPPEKQMYTDRNNCLQTTTFCCPLILYICYEEKSDFSNWGNL